MSKAEKTAGNINKVDDNVKNSLIEEHGKDKLRFLELPEDDLGITILQVIVKIPSRNVMSQFMRFIDNNPKKAQEILVNSCLLTSKEKVNADDALFNTCVSGLSELFPIRQATVKNL